MTGRQQQAGAVLVIGLMLLMVLTTLAISTVSTATVELAMAGNDQYVSRAFQAADAGIAQVLAEATFDSATAETITAAMLANGDRFTAVLRPRGSTEAPLGYSAGFAAEHFEIESTGASLRGTKLTLVQGLFVVQALATPNGADAPTLPPVCLGAVEIRPGVCAAIGSRIRTYWRQVAAGGL